MADVIHLATGIICGGDKLWCGAEMETEFREKTGKLHVLNATRDQENCTCGRCLRKYIKALEYVESFTSRHWSR